MLAGAKPLVMGIVNVTPDSFSDGGSFIAAEAAADHALRHVAAGAAIVDIGGESTRPGFVPVTAEEELGRVTPVLEALAGRLPVPVSIDTTKAVVAEQALRRGATIVNDVWGLQGDPRMAGTVAGAGAGVVIMHNRHAKDDRIDIADDLLRFFETSLRVADQAGIARAGIMLDPGIGFGKTPGQQVGAIAAIPRLRALGFPILVGLSRKSFLAPLSEAPLADRLPHTLAANLAALSLGASVFRVHDVAAHVAALQVFGAIAPRPAR